MVLSFERGLEGVGLINRVATVDDETITPGGKFRSDGTTDAAATAGDNSYWGGGFIRLLYHTLHA